MFLLSRLKLFAFVPLCLNNTFIYLLCYHLMLMLQLKEIKILFLVYFVFSYKAFIMFPWKWSSKINNRKPWFYLSSITSIPESPVLERDHLRVRRESTVPKNVKWKKKFMRAKWNRMSAAKDARPCQNIHVAI